MIRMSWLALALVLGAGVAHAEDIVQGGVVVDGKAYFEHGSELGDGCGCSVDNACQSAGGCGHHGCGLFGHGGGLCGKNGACGSGRRAMQNLWENCNCNGSYKYPVPPLYTYFWPGLYSQQLMTNYSSPWRFPPLKPYTDENQTGGLQPVSYASFEPTSAQPAATRHGVESTSSKMRRIYGD